MGATANTGYTATTAKNYLLDAAVVYKDVTYTEVGGFVGTLLGATQGGVTITIDETFRNPEVDGLAHILHKAVGNTIVESATAQVVLNLKEIIADNLTLGLAGKSVAATALEAPTGYKKITTQRYIAAADHLTNLAVFGKISGTTEKLIFIIDNPICTGGIEIGTTDNEEAVLEVTMEAYSTPEQIVAEEYPWRFFTPTIAP